MAEFWRTREFKSLAKKWNKILEDSGFEDAEVQLKEDRALKQRATYCYRRVNELERSAKLEYFLLLGELANKENFPNEVEKTIMLMTADGATVKEILAELEKKGKKLYRNTIRYIVRRWQTKWGIKTWSLKQMNLKKAIE